MKKPQPQQPVRLSGLFPAPQYRTPSYPVLDVVYVVVGGGGEGGPCVVGVFEAESEAWAARRDGVDTVVAVAVKKAGQ